MKCRLNREMECKPSPEYPTGIRPVGDVIEHWQAFRLVQMGVAEPADEECTKRAGMTPEKTAAAQAAYERVLKGIHPEDFERFDAGIIAGYNPDGSYLPGPNQHLADEDEDSDADDELDEDVF